MDLMEYTTGTLRSAIRSPEFWATPHIPITHHRALSHIHNPRAEADDVILLVAHEDGDVMGHAGILPDRLVPQGPAHKVGWFTAWWVSPTCAGRGVGSRLLDRAMELYDGRIAMSAMSEPATRLVDVRGEHRTLRLSQGLHICFHPRRPAAGRLARGFRRVTDAVLVRTTRRRLIARQRARRGAKGVEVACTRQVDAEAEAFINAHRGGELTRRGPDELNWILDWPWVLSAPIGDRMKERYFFSSVDRRFDLLSLKVYQHDAMIGFLLIKVRDDAMSVPYSYFHASLAAQMLDVVMDHVVAMGISDLFLYEPRLVEAFQEGDIPCCSQDQAVRRSFISKAFDEFDLDEYTLQDGDGDTVFY